MQQEQIFASERAAKFESAVRAAQKNHFGERYVGASLSRCDVGNGEISTKIVNYMRNKRNFLLLSGPAGCGKTYIVAAMMEWILGSFSHFRIWKEYDLLKRLREGIEKGWEPSDQLQYLTDDDLIVVDDLGSQGHNEWREKMMFELLDTRYNTGKPTIFTTNLSLEHFKKSYDPRVASRLFSKENTIIDFAGCEDLRQQGL